MILVDHAVLGCSGSSRNGRGGSERPQNKRINWLGRIGSKFPRPGVLTGTEESGRFKPQGGMDDTQYRH